MLRLGGLLLSCLAYSYLELLDINVKAAAAPESSSDAKQAFASFLASSLGEYAPALERAMPPVLRRWVGSLVRVLGGCRSIQGARMVWVAGGLITNEQASHRTGRQLRHGWHSCLKSHPPTRAIVSHKPVTRSITHHPLQPPPTTRQQSRQSVNHHPTPPHPHTPTGCGSTTSPSSSSPSSRPCSSCPARRSWGSTPVRGFI